MAAVRTAAFLCHALRHLFCRVPLLYLQPLPSPPGSTSALLCPRESQQSHSLWLSEQSSGKAPQTPKLPSQPDRQRALLDVRSPPIPLHTFPALAAAHPLPGSPGRTSATEQPPPASGSASTRPAPGRRQQRGHLQDRKKDQPSAEEEQVLSTAVGCRVLQKQLRGQTRAMSVRRVV